MFIVGGLENVVCRLYGVCFRTLVAGGWPCYRSVNCPLALALISLVQSYGFIKKIVRALQPVVSSAIFRHSQIGARSRHICADVGGGGLMWVVEREKQARRGKGLGQPAKAS